MRIQKLEINDSNKLCGTENLQQHKGAHSQSLKTKQGYIPNTNSQHVRSVYVTKYGKSEGKKIGNRILEMTPNKSVSPKSLFHKEETQAQRVSSFLMSDWS